MVRLNRCVADWPELSVTFMVNLKVPAVVACQESLDLHRRSQRPFDRARTELLYGQWLRRQRERRQAREHLRTALDLVERLGAQPWTDHARGELRASGEPPPARGRRRRAAHTPRTPGRTVRRGRRHQQASSRPALPQPAPSTPTCAASMPNSALSPQRTARRQPGRDRPVTTATMTRKPHLAAPAAAPPPRPGFEGPGEPVRGHRVAVKAGEHVPAGAGNRGRRRRPRRAAGRGTPAAPRPWCGPARSPGRCAGSWAGRRPAARRIAAAAG